MQMIIEYARGEGLQTIEGQVLSENTAMLAMCRELGFDIAPDPRDPDTCVVKLAIGKLAGELMSILMRAPSVLAGIAKP